MAAKRLVIFLSCTFAFLLFSSALGAQNPQLERIDSSPPADVSETVRQSLNSSGLRVTANGSVLGEFWFSREIPLKEAESEEALGVAFGKLRESALVGVVHFPERWSDYKNKPVPGGTYTLRYGIQPADGDHMGMSFYRDFLFLIPSSEDGNPETAYGSEQLVDLSTKASGTEHPAILSLFPLYEEVTEPRLLKNEMDQWTLAVPLGSLTLGLVILGHGETEGL
ncbi:hypothetical protein MYX78_05695 [Acidobacteria bacterium AH-259-G07]|nr:hypothetical protein [Acidobacteria bacterium AH-259-G07]